MKSSGYSFTIPRKYNPIDVVLDFIVKNYPVNEYPRILEIASGSGNLSSRLADLSYQVTAMDPRTRYNPNLNYDVIAEPFCSYTDISDYDLGISIHPCGIHKDIIQNFQMNEKALFLIPCCVLTCDNSELTPYKNEGEWLRHLEKMNPKMKRWSRDKLYDNINNKDQYSRDLPISSRDLHPLKAPSPIDVTLLGMVIFSRDSHS